MDIQFSNAQVDWAFRKATLSPAMPIMSDRIKSLAARAMEGAPTLTAGEMRELAAAILDHRARSARQA